MPRLAQDQKPGLRPAVRLVVDRSPERWARIIAEAYAAAGSPLSGADQRQLVSELAKQLAVAIAIDTEMSARANLVLNRGGSGAPAAGACA